MPKGGQGVRPPPALPVLPDAVPDRRVCADRDTADNSRGCVTADVDGDLVQRTGGWSAQRDGAPAARAGGGGTAISRLGSSTRAPTKSSRGASARSASSIPPGTASPGLTPKRAW